VATNIAQDMKKKSEQPVEEALDYHSLYQRSLADLENSRKRMEEEKRQFGKFALEGFIEELLPVIDNFYRATEHIPDEQKEAGWVTGILYIQKQLADTLAQRGVTEISAKVGDQFDPHRHEAIATENNPEIPDDHIIEIKNRGYMLHDRVLRPAHVVVSHHS
jgi:molecular chaperone GrpE